MQTTRGLEKGALADGSFVRKWKENLLASAYEQAQAENEQNNALMLLCLS